MFKILGPRTRPPYGPVAESIRSNWMAVTTLANDVTQALIAFLFMDLSPGVRTIAPLRFRISWFLLVEINILRNTGFLTKSAASPPIWK